MFSKLTRPSSVLVDVFILQKKTPKSKNEIFDLDNFLFSLYDVSFFSAFNNKIDNHLKCQNTSILLDLIQQTIRHGQKWGKT